MPRSYAATLGALAMGLVSLRGAIRGEPATLVAVEAILVLAIYAGIGAIAGCIADYLIRDALEILFRKRVAQYREGLVDSASEEAKSSDQS